MTELKSVVNRICKFPALGSALFVARLHWNRRARHSQSYAGQIDEKTNVIDALFVGREKTPATAGIVAISPWEIFQTPVAGNHR